MNIQFKTIIFLLLTTHQCSAGFMGLASGLLGAGAMGIGGIATSIAANFGGRAMGMVGGMAHHGMSTVAGIGGNIAQKIGGAALQAVESGVRSMLSHVIEASGNISKDVLSNVAGASFQEH